MITRFNAQAYPAAARPSVTVAEAPAGRAHPVAARKKRGSADTTQGRIRVLAGVLVEPVLETLSPRGVITDLQG
jgi:hypothetical protein